VPFPPDQLIDETINQHTKFIEDTQKKAIKMALSNKFSVVTGLKAMGKTFLANLLIEICVKAKYKCQYFSPVKKKGEKKFTTDAHKPITTGDLLNYSQITNSFTSGPQNRLDLDLLVIDDAHFLELDKFALILDAINPKCSVALFGDDTYTYQESPSIFSFFQKPIKVGNIHKAKLWAHFVKPKQKLPRAILEIKNKVAPQTDLTDSSSDIQFFPVTKEPLILENILDLFTREVPNRLNLPPQEAAMVVTFSDKLGTSVGSDNLNQLITNAIIGESSDQKTAKRIQLHVDNLTFYQGLRVAVAKDDYPNKLVQGEHGFVREVRPHLQELQADFSGRIITFSFSQLFNLIPSYAVCAQQAGCLTAPAVIIVLDIDGQPQLDATLLARSASRAQKLAIILGSPKMYADTLAKYPTYKKGVTKSII
jgi:exodeoxyribonuclease V alpha subunit